jgi:murein DD-endopeptidase MepM/ murein hydrolase activator NlpD
VVALFVAGAGAVVASPATTQADPVTDYTPLVVNISGGVESMPGTRLHEVEVSRSIEVDRETLNKQARTQATQRTKALAEIVQAANATERDLRAEARRARQAEREQVQSNQWVLPLAGYQLTATYGEVSSYWATYHTGLDFAAPSGTPLVAVAHGVVTYVGYDGAYGNKTEITLDDGTVIWYAHQTSQSVSVGQEVQAGQQIGTVGATGNVSGPHLHLEVRVAGTGGDVDPYAALVEHGVTP